MKFNNAEVRKDLTALMFIHTGLSFGVVFVLLFFFGCIEIQPEKASLGSEVDPNDIALAIDEAVEGANPFAITKGEGALYVYTQEIEGSAATPYLQLSQQVLATEEVTEGLKVYVLESTYDYEEDETTETSFTSIFRYEDYPGSTMTSAQLDIEGERMLVAQMSMHRGPATMNEVIRTTYHDLYVTNGVSAPPVNVSSRDNCGGVPNCEIAYTKISYARADWTSEDDFDKIVFEMDISTTPPFLGVILRECQATQVPVEDRRFYLKTCRTLTDFLYGE